MKQVGIFTSVTQGPVHLEGVPATDLAGSLEFVSTSKTPYRIKAGVLPIEVPSQNVQSIFSVVAKRESYGRWERFQFFFHAGIGRKAQDYVCSYFGNDEDIRNKLNLLSDGRFNCLLATVLNDGNKEQWRKIITNLCQDEGDLSAVTDWYSHLPAGDRPAVDNYLLQGEIKGSATAIQKLRTTLQSRPAAPAAPVIPLPSPEGQLAEQLRANYQSFRDSIGHQLHLVNPGRVDRQLVFGQLEQLGNSIEQVVANRVASMEEIGRCAQASRPIAHPQVIRYMQAYLAYKKVHGNDQERALYSDMSLEAFFNRLIGPGNMRHPASQAQLRELGFFPDETEIVSLLGVALPTPFINKGDRHNRGVFDPHRENYVQHGIAIGSVGTDLYWPNSMEWKQMVVTREQNTEANGYGRDNPRAGVRGVMARELYGPDFHFPTYDEAAAEYARNPNGRFIRIEQTSSRYGTASPIYLDTVAFKRHQRLVLEPFLFEAAERARSEGKKAYVRPTGLGLGAWALEGRGTGGGIQQEVFRGRLGSSGASNMAMVEGCLFVQVFAEILHDHPELKEHISTIDFRWIPGVSPAPTPGARAEDIHGKIEGVPAIASLSNFADPLPPGHENDLLVTQWAWAVTFPGNEYWFGALDTTDDPAMSCCSLAWLLGNGRFNPHISYASLENKPVEAET